MLPGPVIAMACRVLPLAFGAGLLISCASAATPGRAADAAYPSVEGPVPVLVLGEDRNPDTLPRHDPAFRRVVVELQAAMARRGFRVVDEDAMAAGLGWSRVEGRDRRDLLEVARLANAAEWAGGRIRAAVLFRIEGSVTDLAYTSRVELHLSGEIVDAVNSRFLASFDLPAETVSTAGRCPVHACASQAVAARVQDLAAELGDVLARKLAYLAPPERAGPALAGPASAGAAPTVLEGIYSVTLRNLAPADVMAIVDVMTGEFPGYRSHALLRRAATLRRYEYVTTADPATLERWLTLLLVDMGLDPAGPVALSVRPGEILIEQVLPTAGAGSTAGGG